MTSDRLFRLIIRLYPAAYRTAHEAETVSTARESLASQGRVGATRELADLTVHALRERTRLTATSAVGAVAAVAAPLAAGSAVALSLVFTAFAEWTKRRAGNSQPAHGFGPFATLGAIPYLIWILVFLAAVFGRGAAARRLTGIAMAASVALVPLAHLTHMDRPRLYVLGSLVLFGMIVLAAPIDPLGRSPLDRRALTVCTLVMTGILSGISLEYGPLWYWGNDTIDAIGALMPGALGFLLLVSVLCMRLNRRLPFAVIVVMFPWGVFCYGTPGRPSLFFGGVVCAAALAGFVLLLPKIDVDHRRDRPTQSGPVPPTDAG
ncbi:hypothetical protein NE236_37885 [Actinoallomurus purpureus]|uniref:hypothetical protein n=1 Tax=Actinoallomurus purpureus TaxID=478114 RepID=UPI0020927A77|nr:hypothetical protein [Actinoallomurus purpureus]MCO6010746.1 hypothetical protein [Actinoallomurus purpureus]